MFLFVQKVTALLSGYTAARQFFDPAQTQGMCDCPHTLYVYTIVHVYIRIRLKRLYAIRTRLCVRTSANRSMPENESGISVSLRGQAA